MLKITVKLKNGNAYELRGAPEQFGDVVRNSYSTGVDLVLPNMPPFKVSEISEVNIDFM